MQSKKSSNKSLIFLLRRYAKPYAVKILILVTLSIGAGFVLPLSFLVLAPALHIMTLSNTTPATSIHDLTLNNLGPTLLSIMNWDSSNVWNVIIAVAVLYIVITILYSVLDFSAYIMAMRVRTDMSRDLHIDLQRHLLSQPISFFHSRKAGDLISRFTEDARGTAYALDSVIRGIGKSCVQIAFYIIILVKTEPLLALAAIILSTGHFLITRQLSERLRSGMLAQNIALGRLSAVLQETILAIRVVKSFAAEMFELKRFRKEAENHRCKTMRFAFSKHIEEPSRFIADAIAVSLMLLITFYAMQVGRITLEGFALFIVLARQIIAPISQLAMHALGISSMLGAAERVIEMFNIKNKMQDGTFHAKPLRRSIELKNVSFSYEKGSPVIHNITLKIKKGETVAIVGPSGAGKSTLVDLILRLYDPLSGTVVMDGKEIQQYTQASYRRQFGVVPQECLLFNAPVRDNILYGRAYDEKQMQRSVEAGNAMEFIAAMPEGMGTLLGERGVRLSGGQRQRIAIARAVYGNPSILVLDEATSSLDTQAEMQVQQAIDNIIQGMTAIVIAHRLSTVRNADKIVVLRDGRIENIGRHDELLRTSQTYKKLYEVKLGKDENSGDVKQQISNFG
jgi:ATP-binding cassette, subfamily B, bacterial MsbA